MPSLNRVTILGHLGRDPDIRYSSSGDAVASLSIATSESTKVGEEWKEKTEWHRIVAWKKTAEIAGKLHKGDGVYVDGKLTTRKWTGKDGKDNYTTEIVAKTLWPLGKIEKDEPQKQESRPSAAPEDVVDDIPF